MSGTGVRVVLDGDSTEGGSVEIVTGVRRAGYGSEKENPVAVIMWKSA